ncbi:beta-lactamase family protein [Candidatus Saccharibacteria bacterium]|nr:beta-lactamase family protein [Candidatus Saccharibacteria bacterium]
MRTKYLLIAIVSLSAVLGGGTFAHASTKDKINIYVNEAVEQSKIPGIEMTVIQDGVLKPSKSYGNLKADNIMPIGSISKPLTSYAIMKLVEGNKLKLDDKLSSYISELNLTHEGSKSDVTVRQLLNHTSGLSTAEGRRLIGTNDNSVYRHAMRLSNAQLMHQPGTTFEYSNANYAILGALIEKVSNQSYADFMHKNVFMPLGMYSTSADVSVTQSTNFTSGYQSWFGFNVPSTIKYNPGGAPYGYVASTAHDLGTFLIAQLNTSDKLIRETQESSTVIDQASKTYYGLGWVLREQEGRNIILHAGDNADYSSFMQLDLNKGNGVVVMINRNHYLEPTYSIDIGLGILNIINNGKSGGIGESGGMIRLIGAFVVLLSIALLVFYAAKPTYRGKKRKALIILAVIFCFVALLLPVTLLKLIEATLMVAFMNAPDVTIAVLFLELLLVVFVLLVSFYEYRFKMLSIKNR